MRHLVSGLTAALTALVLGTVIAGTADAARAADAAKQAAPMVVEDPAAQAAADAGAYREELQQALLQLQRAYAELQARDAAYREMVAASQANVDRLQASNQALQRQLVDATARIQRAEAQAQALTASTTRRARDGD